jgi:hypothetical protein
MNRKRVKYALVFVVLFFPVLEGIVRITGGKPFENLDYNVRINPEPAFIANDSLGIELRPGVFEFQLNDSIKFSATHDESGKRAVSLIGQTNIDKPKVALLGCSFTYGYGVYDSESFPFLLQAKNQAIQIQNYAVPGYGTVQSLLQLDHVLAQNPKQVVLNFSSLHFMRNTLNLFYRQSLKLGYTRSRKSSTNFMSNSKFPFVEEGGDAVMYEEWSDVYSNWPGREQFAAINWIQSLWDRVQYDKTENINATFEVINQISEKCQSENVAFIVSCIDSTSATQELKQKCINKQIKWAELNFDFTNEKLTNLPYDTHPNAEGHRILADKISTFIYQP